jgi:hypothetical protein
MKRENQSQKGSIIIYIMIAIFLTGLLVATMTQGSKISASSGQLDAALLLLQSDIKTVQANISECVQTHPEAVDVNGNGTADATDDPNQPFPLYGDLSSGAAGDALMDIKCPGAPVAQQLIFTDAISASLKLLNDTSNYTATYFNDATEGVYLRITRAVPDTLWPEMLSRLENKYSKCAAVSVTADPDPLGADCSGGCFYYWILRRATSSAAFEADCP